MAAKVPIRTVYTGGNATGLAEYQSGEFIDFTYGGTGLAALGTAGQVLKVNTGASALEYGNVEAILNIEGMTDGSGITILDGDKFVISDGGTEKYVTASQISTYIGTELNVNIDAYPDGSGVTVAATDKLLLSDGGTEKYVNASQIDTYVSATTSTLTNKTLTSPDVNAPDIDGGNIDGATIATSDITVGSGKTLDVSGGTLTLANNQISGDKVEGGTIAATTITALTTAGITASANIDIGTFEMRANTFESDVATGTAPLVVASTTKVANLNADLLDGMTTIDEDNMASNSATALPTQQSVKAYVDTQITAEDLDVTSDSGTIAIDLDSETLTIAGGTGLDSSATGNAVTLAIDATVATLTGSQTLTNKTLTSPVVTTPQINDTSADHQYVFAVSELAADRTVTLPLLASADEFTFNAHAQTLTNKSIDLGSNTLTGSVAEFNAALQSESFATLTGSETLTNKSLTAPTITGTAVMATLDISGDVDVDGTLETDALTIDGVTIAETIADTVGAMVGSNTETGIAVTYEDGDNTLDFALGAAQTTITSLLATDIKIGEDDQTKIDFETADEIHFYAANTEQVYVADNIFGPQSDSDVDLGTTSVRWKDAYIDTITTTGNITVGTTLVALQPFAIAMSVALG